uniref:Uncharacterized protein n=1 Tax=Rhodnius prolixus TaxID=13249 RepID=T1HZX8_RHOPR
MNSIQKDLAAFKLEHQSSSKDIIDIKKDVNKLSLRFSKDIKKAGKHILEIKNDNIKLNNRIIELQRSIIEFSQQSYQNILKIDNIPELPNEDLFSIFETLSKEIDIDFDRDVIDSIYRGRTGRNPSHPPIFVKFMKTSIKISFLIKCKLNKKKLSLKIFGLDATSLIYVNEYLSPPSFKVFKEAKVLLKEGKLSRLWTRNGKVMVKLAENPTPIHVRSSEDLLDLTTSQMGKHQLAYFDLFGTDTDCEDTDTSAQSGASKTTKKRKNREEYPSTSSGPLTPFLLKKPSSIVPKK